MPVEFDIEIQHVFQSDYFSCIENKDAKENEDKN